MVFVFDTNVWVSAALGSSSCRRAFDLARSKGKLIRSEETFTELALTLEKPRLQKYLSHQDKIDFLANYLLITEKVEVKTAKLTICRNPKDNILLELAISCHADFLISGDKDLLSLNAFRGVSIISPADYLRMVV
jgi:putative PIN family toxin of toxin-antitoxin system